MFPNSIAVQSFVTIKWQEKKLSTIKVLKFLVFDHLKLAKNHGKQFLELAACFNGIVHSYQSGKVTGRAEGAPSDLISSFARCFH